MTETEKKEAIQYLEETLSWAESEEGINRIKEDQNMVKQVSKEITESMIPSEELLRSPFNV